MMCGVHTFIRRILGTFSKAGLEIESNGTNLEQNNTDIVKKEPTARELEIARLLKEEQEHPDLLDADSDAVWSLKKAQIEKPSRQCPYLDTIDRFAFRNCSLLSFAARSFFFFTTQNLFLQVRVRL